MITKGEEMGDRDMCFGSRSSIFWPLLIGIVIIIWGVSELFGDVYIWAQWDRLWPFFVIGVGLLIIVNVLWRR